MPYVNDLTMDTGLSSLEAAVDRFDICTQEPTTYTEAVSTYTKGFKDHGAAGSGFGAVADRSPSGRKVSSTAITDGAVTGTGTVTHWAATDVGSTRLWATGALSASQGVTSDNTFALPSFDIGMPDAS